MALLLETTLGDLVIDLDIEGSPALCQNFLQLATARYYTQTLIYNIQVNRFCQLGDPAGDGTGGACVQGLLDVADKGGDVTKSQKRFLKSIGRRLTPAECQEKGRVVATEINGIPDTIGSQFLITLADGEGRALDGYTYDNSTESDTTFLSLGRVTEDSSNVLDQLNSLYCDAEGRPFADVRVARALVVHNPFDNPPELKQLCQHRGVEFGAEEKVTASPTYDRPIEEKVEPRISVDQVDLAGDDNVNEEELKRLQQEQEEEAEKHEAKSRAVVLEMLGDLPSAEITAPENVLFVCKLNPVTEDEDLELIFSRFDNNVKAEIIRDHDTGQSLQYAFVEFTNKQQANEAYFKMNNALVDDRRIKVDFSQSVAKVWDRYRQKLRPNALSSQEMTGSGGGRGGGRGGGGRGRGSPRGGRGHGGNGGGRGPINNPYRRENRQQHDRDHRHGGRDSHGERHYERQHDSRDRGKYDRHGRDTDDRHRRDNHSRQQHDNNPRSNETDEFGRARQFSANREDQHRSNSRRSPSRSRSESPPRRGRRYDSSDDDRSVSRSRSASPDRRKRRDRRSRSRSRDRKRHHKSSRRKHSSSKKKRKHKEDRDRRHRHRHDSDSDEKRHKKKSSSHHRKRHRYDSDDDHYEDSRGSRDKHHTSSNLRPAFDSAVETKSSHLQKQGLPGGISSSEAPRHNHKQQSATHNPYKQGVVCSDQHKQLSGQSQSSHSSRKGKQTFACLYTHHKTQKKKKFRDGKFVVSQGRGQLYDADPPPGSGNQCLGETELPRSELNALFQGHSTTIETEKYLVQLEGPWQSDTSSSKGRASGPAAVSESMQRLMSNKFRKPGSFVPRPRQQQKTAPLGNRRRPLQPGELIRRHYGGPEPSFGHSNEPFHNNGEPSAWQTAPNLAPTNPYSRPSQSSNQYQRGGIRPNHLQGQQPMQQQQQQQHAQWPQGGFQREEPSNPYESSGSNWHGNANNSWQQRSSSAHPMQVQTSHTGAENGQLPPQGREISPPNAFHPANNAQNFGQPTFASGPHQFAKNGFNASQFYGEEDDSDDGDGGGGDPFRAGGLQQPSTNQQQPLESNNVSRPPYSSGQPYSDRQSAPAQQQQPGNDAVTASRLANVKTNEMPVESYNTIVPQKNGKMTNEDLLALFCGDDDSQSQEVDENDPPSPRRRGATGLEHPKSIAVNRPSTNNAYDFSLPMADSSSDSSDEG